MTSDYYTHKAIAIRKKLFRDICVFLQICVIVVLAILFLIVFERAPEYFNAGKSPVVNSFGWTGENAVKDKVADTKFTLFHSKYSHQATNPSHDPLDNFYDYACDINEPPMAEIFKTHTKNVLNTILSQPNTQKLNWMQNCKRFHSAPYEDKLKSLADKTRALFVRIEEIDSEFELLDTVAFLHSKGVREPLHLNLWPDGRHVLGTSFQIHERSNGNVYAFLGAVSPKRYSGIPFEQMLGSYHKVHDFIGSEWMKDENIITVSRTNYTNKFHVDPFPWTVNEGTTTMNIHLGIMSTFERAIVFFSLHDWKNYLRIATAKSLLHQLRLLAPSSQEICSKQILELFPLKFCRQISKNVKNVQDAIYNIETAISDAKEYIVNKNYFELDVVTLAALNKHLEEVQVYINKCSINQTRDVLQTIETQFLNSPSSYVDSMLKLISTQDWQSRRNLYYNELYKNMATHMQNFNAKTTPSAKVIRFFPGMLLYPDHLLRMNSPFYYLLLRWPVIHEYIHWAWVFLLRNKDKWSTKLKKLDALFVETYNDGNSFWLHSENVADVLGMSIAYHSYKYDHATSVQDDRQFFLGVGRFLCVSGAGETMDMNDPHSLGRQRLQIPIRLMLEKEFRAAFKITSN